MVGEDIVDPYLRILAIAGCSELFVDEGGEEDGEEDEQNTEPSDDGDDDHKAKRADE